MSGVATNMDGKIGWGVKTNGKASGSVFIGDYMGDASSVETLSADFDGIIDIAMEDHSAYVIDNDHYIYKYRFSGKSTKKTMVSNQLKNPSRLFVLDRYIYVIDKKKGLYVIKTDRSSSSGYSEKA